MELGYNRHSGLLDKKYREFFFPTVLTSMATSLSMVVDGIIVGNLLGASALAAVNLVTPVMMVYTTVAVSLGMGAAAAIAVAKGRRQEAYANDIFTVSLVAMLLLSAVLMVLQILFLDDISHLLTSEPVLLPLVKAYLQVLIFGTPMLVLIPGMVYCLRTDGKVKLASIILITANVVNLILDLVYIGLFDMGIGGSSLATVSGYTIGAGVLLTYVFAKDRTLSLNFKLLAKPLMVLKYTGQVLATGTPGALSTILMTLKILSINTIVLSVAGRSGMVAFSVCISCLALISMFIAGAAQAMMPILGALYGEKDDLGIRFVVRRAFQVLMIASMVVTFILELSPGTVLAVFGVRDAADLAVGIPAVRIFALSLIGTSTSYLMLYYYMTIGRRKIANAISVVQGFAVVVPAAFVLSRLMGAAGVWVAFIFAELVTIGMIALNYLYMKKKSGGKVQNILLLDTRSAGDHKILDLTIRNSIDDVVGVSEKVIAFLSQSGVETKLCNKVGMAIEEMTVNTVKYGYQQGKKNYIDIRVKILEDEIIIVLRDDGSFFDPTRYVSREKEEETYLIGGIELVKAIAEKVEYSRVMTLNNTTITICSGK